MSARIMEQQTNGPDNSSGHLLSIRLDPDYNFLSNDLSTRVRRPYVYIMTCAQAFTIAAITALAVQWRARPWLQRILDLTICLACLSWRQPNLPLLLPAFAMAYTVWTSLPGSLRAMNLPSHSNFMRHLQIVKAPAEQDACGVCWDDGQELAKLPCNHLCCRRCLQLMGDKFQTACPFCRTPLFCNYDRTVFGLSKGSVICATVNAALSLAQIVLETRRSRYLDTLLPLLTLCGSGGYLFMVSIALRHFGQEWWRGTPATVGVTSWSLQMACFACFSGAFLLWQTFWNTNRLVLKAESTNVL